MQIAVLSDLHLGKRNRLDRFAREEAHVEPRFLAMLRHLEKSVDLIVLLGDIFETLKGARPGSARDELHGALDAYPEIARRAHGHPRYRLIYGNHDAVAGRVLGAEERCELRAGKTKLMFFHGHQLDPLTRGRAYLSRAGVFLGGWLERMGVHTTPEDHQPARGGPAWRCAPSVTFARGAVAMGKASGADVVVTGHTHRAVVEEHDGCLFMNSGTCVAGRRELLLLDTCAGRFEVVRD